MTQWPRYEKRVELRAAKITRVEPIEDDHYCVHLRGGVRVHLEGQEPLELSEEWLERHALFYPGYMLRYDNGDLGSLEAMTFEALYDRMDP